MPFGLTGAPATFCEMVVIALEDFFFWSDTATCRAKGALVTCLEAKEGFKAPQCALNAQEMSLGTRLPVG